MANPDECFYHALEVVPAELEDEMLMKPEIRTMQEIIHCVPWYKITFGDCLRPNYDQHPREMAIDDIVTKARATFQKGKTNLRDKDRRGKSPTPTPGKCLFKANCWWCSASGHQKRYCSLYKPMLADNGDTGPEGLKGASEKVRDVWNKGNPRDRGSQLLQITEVHEASD